MFIATTMKQLEEGKGGYQEFDKKSSKDVPNCACFAITMFMIGVFTFYLGCILFGTVLGKYIHNI